MNYLYKFTMAIILTPVIYFVEGRMKNYLGREVASKMKRTAMGKDEEPFINIPAAG
jgi:hypothetical protein